MRVLQIQKAAGISGSERHLLSLLPALQDLGVTVRICLLGVDRVDLLVDAFRARSIDVRVIPAGPDLNPWLIRRLQREIRLFDPDIVHTHLIHADLYGQVAACLDRRVGVSSMHASHHRLTRQPYRSAARTGSHHASAVIAISHHVARWIERHAIAPTDRVRVVHYGIDPSEWQLTDDARAAARRSFGLEAGQIAVGVASRLAPHKGHDVLIEAVASLPAPSEVRLLIAGDGPLRPALEQRAARLGANRVQFLGFVHGIREFMGACDVMAFPTQPAFGEGFGLAALEAMSAGRPLVASDLDSLPEIVEHGKTGVLVAPTDVDGWVGAIQQLAEDRSLASEYGRAGRSRAESNFSLDAMAQSTMAVYDDVLT